MASQGHYQQQQGGGQQQQQRRPTTAHSDSFSHSHARPTTSAGGFPSQQQGQQGQNYDPYGQQQYGQYDIEEEYEEEEEDEDVFAFLPGKGGPAAAIVEEHVERPPTSRAGAAAAVAGGGMRPSTAQLTYPPPTFDPHSRFHGQSSLTSAPPPPAYQLNTTSPPPSSSLPPLPPTTSTSFQPPLQPPPQTPPSTGTASHAHSTTNVLGHNNPQEDYRLRRLNTAATTAVSSSNHHNMTGSPMSPVGGLSLPASPVPGRRPVSARSREVMVNFPGGLEKDGHVGVVTNTEDWEGSGEEGVYGGEGGGGGGPGYAFGGDDTMVVEEIGTSKGLASVAESMSLTPSMLDDQTTGEGSIKMEFDLDAIEEEDSPYPEVRASVSNIDDPDMPAMTIRMWFVGLLLCISSSALNVFFNFRSPAPSVVALVLLLISYPIGKLLAFSLPITTYRIPLPSFPPSILSSSFCSSLPLPVLRLIRPLTFPRAIEFSFNPGPWNIKEHVLVYIMANVAVGSPYALNAIVTCQVYYRLNISYWFSLVLVLATQLTGFGLAGLCRRFLVWPASMVWPQNLVACTLLNTLHAEDEDDVQIEDQVQGRERGMGATGRRTKRPMTRYRFFLVVAVGSFFFFFLPGFVFEALSIFSFICWAVPNNIVVNQLFGVHSGLGMSVLTFDWTQISWIGSPLMVPWWAQLQIFLGFVLFFWILTPVLYYSDAWYLAYFPISANDPYDRFGHVYNVSRVLTKDDRFDLSAYNNYSPLFLPATYAMTYLIAFTLSTCVIVHTVLYHGKALLLGIKRMRVEADDIHAKLMRHYPEVPDWWYLSVFCVFFALAVVAMEVWKTTVPVWALLLSVALPTLYVLPSGFIYAMTGQTITLNILAQIIPGTLLPGNPLANMVFKAYSVQTLSEATSFVQDLKLGHYIKVAPRATFLVQLVATCLAAFVQVGVKEWIFANVPDICSPKQASSLTCPHNQVFFTASAIWGLIGPSRQFGTGSIYHPHLYAIVVGVFLPIPFWLWQRRYPTSWVRWVSTPVILSGVSSIPPATGINYSSWFLVGFIFQYLIRKRNFAWWSKFNYVASSAMDSGTVISLIFIFFTLQFPKRGTIAVHWWGNSVFKNTADWHRVPLRKIPQGGIPTQT